jgi:hypothetical protein
MICSRGGKWCLMLSLVLFTQAWGQPRIEAVGGQKFDIGSLYRGETAEHRLFLRNGGTEDLILGAIDASCGCTGTVASEKTIAPGKTGSILITFNSKTFNGKVHKAITIHSNAADIPNLLVEFTANVVVEFDLEPPQFWFRNAEVGRRCSSFVTLTNNSSAPITLDGYSSKLGGFTMVLPTVPIPPGKSDTLRATFVPDAESHLIVESVVIRLTSQHQRELSIPVYGNARAFKFE